MASSESSSPVFLSSKALTGSEQHFMLIEKAISKTQGELFPQYIYPSGVKNKDDLVKAIYGLYARAIRDLSQKDLIYGGTVCRDSYVFATNHTDLNWMLSSGLFDSTEIYAGCVGDIIKTIEGLRFSKVGKELLMAFENDKDFTKKYSRSGLYQRLLFLAKNLKKQDIVIELSPPLGFLDSESAGLVQGELLEVFEDPYQLVLRKNKSFTMLPSFSLKVRVSHISPEAKFRLSESNPSSIKNDIVTISLDELFYFFLLDHKSVQKRKAVIMPIIYTD